METARTITVIPAKINPVTGRVESTVKRRRVAGYARVSTDKDEQFTSFKDRLLYAVHPEQSFLGIREGLHR